MDYLGGNTKSLRLVPQLSQLFLKALYGLSVCSEGRHEVRLALDFVVSQTLLGSVQLIVECQSFGILPLLEGVVLDLEFRREDTPLFIGNDWLRPRGGLVLAGVLCGSGNLEVCPVERLSTLVVQAVSEVGVAHLVGAREHDARWSRSSGSVDHNVEAVRIELRSLAATVMHRQKALCGVCIDRA